MWLLAMPFKHPTPLPPMIPANTPRTVVVTGAAGFIGSHTVDRLLSDGHRVLGIDDLSSGSTTNLTRVLNHDRFEFVVQDIVTPRFLETFCERHRPDALIHLAGLVSVARAEDDPELNFRLNVKATQVVAEAARRCDIPRVVFASSAAVYGDAPEPPLRESSLAEPLGNYGNAKLISELLLRQYSRSYGMTTVCNRYFNVFGPRQDPSSPYSGVISLFTDRFARGLPVTIFGDGHQTRDFVSVYDVAAANTLAATAPAVESGSYNICTGESRSLLDLVDILQSEYPLAQGPQFAEERLGDIRHSLGSPRLSREKLGFRARVDFREAIEELTSAHCVTSQAV